MSVRFKKFLYRVGKNCEFKPIENRLLLFLKKESEQKIKNYPKLMDKMRELWPKYADGSKISYLLKDHHDQLFNFYISTIFPFRKSATMLDDPEAPTPVDFKLVYNYTYNQNEVKAVENILKELKIEASTPGILKRIFIFTISSFAYMIEQIFERPFAMQFFSIDGEETKDGGYKVNAIISGREQ